MATTRDSRGTSDAAHKQLDCSSDFDQGVAIFTTLPIVDSETKLFAYGDQYVCKRAAVRVALSINGSTVQVFTSHATVGDAAGNTTAFGNWAATFSRPQLLSCDCNTTDGTSLLKTTALDAWPVVSTDPGVTFPGEGRIDYWFSDANDGLYPIAADLPSTSLSDHIPLRVTYAANLLAKGGFEEYTPPALAPEWGTDRTTHAMSETHQPRTGLQNAACWQTDGTDCGVFQDFTVSTAGTYTATVFAAADVAGGIVGANLNGALAVPSKNVTANGFDQYSNYSFTFSATAGQTIRIWMYSSAIPGNPGHYVVVDDAALTVQ